MDYSHVDLTQLNWAAILLRQRSMGKAESQPSIHYPLSHMTMQQSYFENIHNCATEINIFKANRIQMPATFQHFGEMPEHPSFARIHSQITQQQRAHETMR
jgi:hypothetical protein